MEVTEELKSILDLVNEGIVFTNLTGVITKANQKAARTHGYGNAEALIGQSVFNLVAHRDHQMVRTNLQQAREIGVDKPRICSLVKTDGSQFFGEIKVAVIRDAYGFPSGLVVVISDITEPKYPEELPRFERDRLIGILDSMDVGIYIVNRQYEIEYVNPELARQFGPINGRKCYEYLHNRNGPCLSCKNDAVFNEGRTVHWERYYENTGKTFDLVDTPFRNANGTLSKLEIFHDITGRKEAERLLRESEEFRSTLLSNSPYPILVINPDSSIRYVNPALEELTGLSSSEIIGIKPPYPWWMTEDPQKITEQLQWLRSTRVRKAENLFKRKDGQEFWVEATVAPVKINRGVKYYISSWTDITEQKRLRENMHFYITEVTRAQEQERKRIARELHDETAQSLSSLYIKTESILVRREELPAEVVGQLEHFLVDIDNMLREVRRFSHELRPALLDQLGLVLSLELLTQEVQSKAKLHCRMEVLGSERRLSIETELALFRICQEALCNVKKHSRATECSLTIEFTSKTIKMIIADNGIGFKAPKMLSNFVRKGKLGIAGISERVRLLNGSLSVESKVGQGTTLTVNVMA